MLFFNGTILSSQRIILTKDSSFRKIFLACGSCIAPTGTSPFLQNEKAGRVFSIDARFIPRLFREAVAELPQHLVVDAVRLVAVLVDATNVLRHVEQLFIVNEHHAFQHGRTGYHLDGDPQPTCPVTSVLRALGDKEFLGVVHPA